MGRYKKTKTIIEVSEYLLRRREQNRINQMKYRRRRKIVNLLKNKTIGPTQTKKEFINDFSQHLKGLDFDYYLTLTNREFLSIKSLFHFIPKFITQLKN
jgi:hypothetical protein